MSTPATPDSNAADPASHPTESPPDGLTAPPPQSQQFTRILFPLGHLVATPGALRACTRFGIDPIVLARRHVQGDWGDLCAEDVATNNEALVCGNRLLSAYTLSRTPHTPPVTAEHVTDGAASCVIWIITEADRSVTTLLLPRDY